MIQGAEVKMKVVDEQGITISARDLCISRVPEARPHEGEFVWTKDGTRKYLVVSGEWCLLDDVKEQYGFKLTLREVEVNTGGVKWVKA